MGDGASGCSRTRAPATALDTSSLDVVDGIDTSGLLPPDVIAALRSFPRRFTTATDPARLTDGDADRRDELARRHGTDGTSAQDHLRNATRTLQLIAGAIDEVLQTEGPTLHPACTDRARRSWPEPPGESTDGLLTELVDADQRLIERLEAIAPAAWARTATVADDGERTVGHLAAELVGTVADDLRWIERNLRPDPRP